MRAPLGKEISLFVIIALCSAQSIHAQFIGLESEVHATSVHGTTYRIYAEFGSATDECVAVYSVGAAEDNPVTLELGVSTSFYQNGGGANLGSGINAFFLTMIPEIGYDSWFTIGSETNEDPTISSIGMAGAFTEFNNGNGFVLGEGAVGGSWYITPGSNDLALAGDDGLVLLGQFTATDDADGSPGIVTCDWNIQWRDAEGAGYYELGATHDTADNYVFGCTDEVACNYNSDATDEDGSCEYPTVASCSAFEPGPNETWTHVLTAVTSDDPSSGEEQTLEIEVSALPAGGAEYRVAKTVANGNWFFGSPVELSLGLNTVSVSAVAFQRTVKFQFSSGEVEFTALVINGEDVECDANETLGCTDAEIPGCSSSSATNYNPAATDDDGSCTWPEGLFTGLSYDLIGHNLIEGTSTYRLYANFNPDTLIQVVASYGTEEEPWEISSTEVFHQDEIGALLAHSINPALFAFFPELEHDTWLALGGGPGSPIELQTMGLANFFTDFEESGANVLVNTVVGASLYYIPVPDGSALSFVQDGQFLLGQFTTSGVVSVKYNLHFRDAVSETHYATDLNLVFPTFSEGCTNETACNYNDAATEDDNSCIYALGCETCSGETDGTGTIVDNDADFDGVCDSDEIVGCQDAAACNFDPSATDDSGDCIYAMTYYDCSGACINDFDGDGVCNELEVFGCTFPIACNYDYEATEDDGSCIFYCPGCVDQSACNFDPNAIQDDGSCIYPLDIFGVDFLDCNGNCLSDNDGDGVCDEEEIQGCMDSNACDYDEAATDQLLPCIYPDAAYNCEGFCLFDLDEDGICDEFDSCPEDPENDLDADGVCSNDEIEGCTNEQACNFVPTATEEDGSCLLVETICGDDHFTCDCTCISDIDGDEICDEDEVLGCQEVSACNYNPNATDSDGTCEWATCAGCIYSFACNFDPTAIYSDGSCEFGTCQGCTNPLACNFNPTVNGDDGSCYFTEEAYDCEGNCLNDSDEDGLCDEFEFGCTDQFACNYIANADNDDGSCEYSSCAGCTDESACNYDAEATSDDGSCTYTETYYDCYGNCLNDADADGICDSLEFAGCMDELACNYEANSTDDDGTCEYETCAGCTNPIACNYDIDATSEDGSCFYAVDGYDCDSVCLNDADGDGTCDEFEVAGCIDATACNYDADATDDDGSCAELDECGVCGGNGIADGACDCEGNSPETSYDCGGNCLNDADGDGVCDEFEILGCTDETACNYSSDATDDDGTCLQNDECGVCGGNGIADGACDCEGNSPEASYDCGGNCLNDADGDGVCDEFEVLGCTDETACNYSSDATEDDGSCTVYDECGVCGGNGIADGACDCEGNSPEASYDCGGNCLNDADGDGVCDEFEVLGCTDETACNYSSDATDDDGTCLQNDECGVCGGNGIADGACDCAGNGPEAGYDCGGNCLNDADGDGVCDEFEVLGCTDETACTYNLDATDDDGSCDYLLCIGCTDDVACNYDSNALYEDGSCDYSCLGCTNPYACNYDPDALLEDGSCNYTSCVGCTDQGACNYDSIFTVDNGSCDYSCLGCMDETACNYDASATVNDGSCTYAETYYDCDGNCLMDMDSDGVCDELEVDGCLDEAACNYNIYATNDDDSCDYCFCGEGTYWDDLAQACLVIETCEEDLDGDGVIGVEDLLQLLSSFGMECDLDPETSEFNCGDPVNYHGYDYATVQIGGQCWFAENLRVESYKNGDAIPSSLSDSEWANTTSGAVAVYGEGDSYCESQSPDGDACDETWSVLEYGRLYNWHSVIDERGLCPNGWHVPEFDDWSIMDDLVDGVANKLKTTYGWYNSGSGSNESGFSGLPGGLRNGYDGGFSTAGYQGAWWTSSDNWADNSALEWWLRSDEEIFGWSGAILTNGLSVRCLKD